MNWLIFIGVTLFAAGLATKLCVMLEIYPEHIEMQRKLWSAYVVIGLVLAGFGLWLQVGR